MVTSSAGTALIGVTLVLLALAPSTVQGNRSLLQSDGPLLTISNPGTAPRLGFGNATSVGVGFTTFFIFFIGNVGNAPAPSATISIQINNAFTFSNPYAGPREFNITISPDGHSITAIYNGPIVPSNSQGINFQVTITATAPGPQEISGLTGSALPGGAPYQRSTPAVTPASQGVCGTPGAAQDFPTLCFFNNDPAGRYVCCDAQGCDGFNADGFTPHCKNFGYAPPQPAPFMPATAQPPPTGDQGVCGSGPSQSYPIRCWYNSDPQGRYICCDNKGCGGFTSGDNFTPKCAANGFDPFPPPPVGDQGVCGSGPAQDFLNRCYFNNDPQHRYVCCDSAGCAGFNPDNLTPRCRYQGYVPTL